MQPPRLLSTLLEGRHRCQWLQYGGAEAGRGSPTAPEVQNAYNHATREHWKVDKSVGGNQDAGSVDVYPTHALSFCT